MISRGQVKKWTLYQLVSFFFFFLTPNGLWLYYQEKPHFVYVCVLSHCVSWSETSDVQEALWRNIPYWAKCWWERVSVSADKEDVVRVVLVSLVLLRVCVSLRFSQSLGWCRKVQTFCCLLWTAQTTYCAWNRGSFISSCLSVEAETVLFCAASTRISWS